MTRPPLGSYQDAFASVRKIPRTRRGGVLEVLRKGLRGAVRISGLARIPRAQLQTEQILLSKGVLVSGLPEPE